MSVTRDDIMKIIGKPWAVPCDPPDSFDCWELVAHVRSLGGLVTPSYVDRIQRKPSDRSIIETPPTEWYRLILPTHLCVARIDKGHVGVYLGGDRVIHAQFGAGVRIDPLMVLGNHVTFWEHRND